MQCAPGFWIHVEPAESVMETAMARARTLSELPAFVYAQNKRDFRQPASKSHDLQVAFVGLLFRDLVNPQISAWISAVSPASCGSPDRLVAPFAA